MFRRINRESSSRVVTRKSSPGYLWVIRQVPVASRTVSIFISVALSQACKIAYASFKRRSRMVMRLECVSSPGRLDSWQSISRRSWDHFCGPRVTGNRLSGDATQGRSRSFSRYRARCVCKYVHISACARIGRGVPTFHAEDTFARK